MLVASSAICAFWNSSESNIPFKGYVIINDAGSLVDSTRLNGDFIEIPLEHLLDRTVLTRFYWA